MPPPKTAPARAVLYLRQSVSREDSISLELQESASRAYCKERGYTVVAVEQDPGISGRTFNRPAVQRVMAMIAAKEADVVVLWKWSRLARARLDWAVAVDKVESVGGRIESATEPLDTTNATGRLARGMMAEFAAFESERISDTWKETLQRRVARGLPGNGGARFGYTQPDKMTYLPDPETGPALAEMYAMYNRGETLWSVSRWLNQNGVTTTTGARWERAKVQAVLDSGFGAGMIVTNSHKPAERYYSPGAHPAVIDAPTWAEYRARRSVRSQPGKISHPKYMLTGLVKCGDCGAPMHAMARGNAMEGYGCSKYIQYKTGRYVTTSRIRLEGEVEKWLREFAVDSEEQRQASLSMRKQKTAAVQNSKSAAAAIAKLDAAIIKSGVDLATGDIEAAEHRQIVDVLRERRAALELREVAALDRAQVAIDMKGVASGLLDLWPRMNPEEKRKGLAMLIDRIVVHPPPVELGGKGSGKRMARYQIVPRWEAPDA
jgi:site-specific DNA recombinase